MLAKMHNLYKLDKEQTAIDTNNIFQWLLILV